MVIVTALRASLRVASGPDAHVYAIDRAAVLFERMTGNQLTQSSFVDPPAVQRGVETAPAAAVCRFQAQMNRRRDNAGRQDGVGEVK